MDATPTAAQLPGPLLALYARLSAWRRHANHIYGLCQTQMLEWPSLTLEFLPDRRNTSFPDFSLHYVAVGTQALPGSLNYVSVMEFAVPVDFEEMADFMNGEDSAMAAHGAMFADVKGHTRQAQLLPVAGIVHKLRTVPQSTDIMAVMTSASPHVPFYRLDARPPHSADPADHNADFFLRGLNSPGFAIDISTVTAGSVVAGCDDGTMALWDAASLFEEGPDETGATAQGTAVDPVRKYLPHCDTVHDVSCHGSHPSLFVAAFQSGTVSLWDNRVALSPSATITEAHAGGVFGAALHPTAAFNIATCGADGVVALWDARKVEMPVATLAYHTSSVTGVQWSPFNESALLSYGLDGNVCLWDMGRKGLPASKEGDANAPPELAFVHAGLLSRVTEARWCPNVDDEWLVAACDATNVMQLFRPLRSVTEEHLPAEAFDVDVMDDED